MKSRRLGHFLDALCNAWRVGREGEQDTKKPYNMWPQAPHHTRKCVSHTLHSYLIKHKNTSFFLQECLRKSTLGTLPELTAQGGCCDLRMGTILQEKEFFFCLNDPRLFPPRRKSSCSGGMISTHQRIHCAFSPKLKELGAGQAREHQGKEWEGALEIP